MFQLGTTFKESVQLVKFKLKLISWTIKSTVLPINVRLSDGSSRIKSSNNVQTLKKNFYSTFNVCMCN